VVPESYIPRTWVTLCYRGQRQLTKALESDNTLLNVLQNWKAPGVMDVCFEAAAMRQLDGINAQTYSSRARTYSAMQKYDLAIKDADEAVKLAKEDKKLLINMHFVRATILRPAGQDAKAIEDLTYVIKRCPPDAEQYLMRAKSYEVIKNYDAAVADLTKVLELDGPNGQVYMRRAAIYEKLGRKDLMEQDKQLAAKTGFKPKPTTKHDELITPANPISAR
jgi:tetratricopeptide (TPR) repeat protein